MTITTPPLFPNANSAAAPQAPEKPKATISSDFETFLKMLTVQMENQDPLNPIESSEYAVQLATFSSVEQQVMTNDLLTALTSKLAGVDLAQYATWVGMEARSTSPAKFSGQPMELAYDSVANADKATLLVKNDLGAVVQRVALPDMSGAFTWSGKDKSGFPMAAGVYSFDVEYSAKGAVTDTRPAQTFSAVREIQMTSAGPMLVLEAGKSVDPSAITALRQPDPVM